MYAGFETSVQEIMYALMDADLQDPPSLLPANVKTQL